MYFVLDATICSSQQRRWSKLNSRATPKVWITAKLVVTRWQLGQWSLLYQRSAIDSSHRKNLCWIFVSTVLKRQKYIEKRPGMAHFLRKTWRWWQQQCKIFKLLFCLSCFCFTLTRCIDKHASTYMQGNCFPQVTTLHCLLKGMLFRK